MQEDDIGLGVADFLANPEEPVVPRLRNSLLYGVQQNPDVQGRMRALARKQGLPLPAALGDQKYVETRGKVDELDPNGMVLGMPKTANWLAHEDNAAIAYDDAPQLGAIENLAAGIGERAAQLGGGLVRGLGTLVDKPADALTKATDALGIPTIVDFGPSGLRLRTSNAADIAKPAGGLEQQADALKGADLGYEPGTTWDDVKQQPLAKFLPFALEQGIVSVPDMVAVLASLPVYVAGRTGEIGQDRAENDKRGDATVADLAAALPAATASALLERLGTRGILGIDDAVKGGLKGVPKAVGAAALKEGATEAGQEAVEGLGETLGTAKGVNLGELGERMLAAGVGGAGFGGTVRTVTGSVQATVEVHQERMAKAQAAQGEAQAVGDMMQAAEASLLRPRDPHTFKEYVESVTTDTPVENVYVSAQELANALAQGAPDQIAANAKAMEAMPDVQAQLEDALPSNGLVQIPVAELLAFTPETGLAQSLVEHLKIDPNGMSMAEAELFMQEQAAGLQADVTSAITQSLAAEQAQASSEVVRANIEQQLTATQRFTPDVNAAYSELVSAFYTTQAARLGVTPEALFEQHPLNIKASGVMGDSLTQPKDVAQFDMSDPYAEGGDRRGARETEFDGGFVSYSWHQGSSTEAPYVTVDSLYVEPTARKSGKGRAAMEALLRQADAAGVRVALTAEPVGFKGEPKGAGKSALEKFYKSLGFTKNSDPYVSAAMLREPQTLKQSGRMPFSDSLATPPTPTPEIMAEHGRVEDVPLAQARSTQSARGGESPGALVEGYEDMPVAVRREDGEYLVYDGHHRTEAAMANGDTTMKMHVVDAKSYAPESAGRPAAKIDTDALARELGLEQPGDAADARGTFHPGTNTIVLLKNADLSTFLHEAGHFYLETLARLAADPNAPDAIKEDWARAATFLGVEGSAPDAWLNGSVDQRREGHETWARAFEAYLREGKAPSTALQNLFRRFKAWLVHVYKNLTQLNVELTPEVRAVFDRLLATDEDIARAEAERQFLPVLAEMPPGMDPLEWEQYQRLGAEATVTAQEELSARSIRDLQWTRNQHARIVRDLTKTAKETRKAVKAEVEAEVLAEPVYAAQHFLKRGVLQGEPFEGVHKLSISEVAAIYEGTAQELQDWRKLGYGRYGMLAEDGLNPDHVAEWFGFSSGHELVENILNAQPMAEVVEGRTDQRMLERHGDLADERAINRAADEAVHNEVRLKFIATEANALAKATGGRRILAEAARDYARGMIGTLRIRDLRPGKFTGASTRAAVAAERAAAKGDLVTAAGEKRNQLINSYAAKEAFEAQNDVEKILRYFDRLQGAAAVNSIDVGYREQIDNLLERFDLRKGQSLKAIDKRTSLKNWIEAQQAKGLDPVIDPALENEAYRQHYKNLTVDEMRGLHDAVRNIVHLGRLKNRLLVAAKGRAFQEVVDEAEAMIRDNAYQTKPVKLESNTIADRALSGFQNFFAIHRKFSSLVREMSGLENDGGVLWSAFIEPMNAANDKEAVMREQATLALADVFKALDVKKGDLRRKLYIPAIGRSLSLEGRLAVALNWGNELNRARIMDGDKWSAEQVGAILGTLTPAQLDFVNKMWAYLDSYWTEIAAKERRVTGVTPEKVEAEPFELVASDGSVVQMRGGYYPIKYDTERSTRAETDEAAEAIRAALRGAYTRATTRRGHTKARVDKVERPVRKDLMVPFGHVNQVIHDLAFHEYLIDANRLASNPQIDSAMRDHYGVEVVRTIRKTLDDIAEGDVPAQDSLERAMNYIRTGTTIAGLGWNLTTGLLQPLGLTQSIVRIGPKYMAKGIGKAFADAASLQNTVEAIGQKSDFMRLRAKTFMREINEVQNQVKDSFKPEAWGPVEQSFFFLIQKLQLVADVPTWLGAYEKAQDQGHDEKTAVALADQAVRDSQGGGQIGDLAQIQRGSVWFKLWTNFYSFFNVGYNQMAESLAETRRVGPARLPMLAADVALIAFVPAVMGELMKHALRGEEWDWDELGPQLVKSQVSYLLGFMVGLRELGGMISSDGKAVSGPASLRLLTQDMPRLYQQVKQGEADDALRKAAINTAGVLLHFPSGQINRTIDGLEALAKGETKNPMAVFVGPPRNK